MRNPRYNQVPKEDKFHSDDREQRPQAIFFIHSFKQIVRENQERMHKYWV